MSVSSHLAVSPRSYDRRIRLLLPHYDELVTAAASAIHAALRPIRLIVDLGIGTGALAQACLSEAEGARLVGIDADAGMMTVAAARLHKVGSRVRLIHGSFLDQPLPASDAIVASYSLHHIRSKGAKQAFYRRCYRSLRPGGVLISGDCMPAALPRAFARDLDAWMTHLARAVGGRARARRVYESWSDEDVYVPLVEETRLFTRAGFMTDVSWRRGPFAVLVGLKPKRR